MRLRSLVLTIVRESAEPMTAASIVNAALMRGAPFKRGSIEKEIHRLSGRGWLTNVNRHPTYGNVERQPGLYVLGDGPTSTEGGYTVILYGPNREEQL